MVRGHEGEGGVEVGINDREVFDAVDLDDGGPVVDAAAAQRVHADLQAGLRDGFHVHDGGQGLDVGHDVIFKVCCGELHRALKGDAFNGPDTGFDEFIGAVLDF